MKTITLLLFDDVEELDAVGPYEVLASWTAAAPEDGYGIVCLSPDGKPVRAAKGMRFGADGAFTDVADPAVVIHPGGWGTRALLADPAHLDLVRSWSTSGALMTSVCTGSLVYAAAGLLGGRPATTHWRSLDILAGLDASIDVRPDDRFVDDGEVITAAGVSAGIDMALHLVDRLAGVERAREVRRAIQYDPSPPV